MELYLYRENHSPYVKIRSTQENLYCINISVTFISTEVRADTTTSQGSPSCGAQMQLPNLSCRCSKQALPIQIVTITVMIRVEANIISCCMYKLLC